MLSQLTLLLLPLLLHLLLLQLLLLHLLLQQRSNSEAVVKKALV
jgi:hypothetical protein